MNLSTTIRLLYIVFKIKYSQHRIKGTIYLVYLYTKIEHRHLKV